MSSTFILVIQCPNPPYIPGGFFTCKNGDQGTNTYGAQCSFNCNRGYILKGSATKLTCDINGKWTGTQSKCERKCVDMCDNATIVIVIIYPLKPYSDALKESDL